MDMTDYGAIKLTSVPKDDRPRLKTQRKAYQAKKKLMNLRGWVGHPAREVWRGHEKALCYYGLLICQEWASRGFTEDCGKQIADIGSTFPWTGWPDWIEDSEVHLHMRQSLRYKEVVDNANWIAQEKMSKVSWRYRNLWPDVEAIYGYVWSEDAKRRGLQVSEDEAILSLDWLLPEEIKESTRKFLEAA